MTDKRNVKKEQNKKNSAKKDNKKSSFSWFFWFFVLVTVAFGYFVAQLNIIELNFENPLQSNYIELPEMVPFEGNLAANDKLTRASRLAEGKLRGPETIVFAPDGSMYTGLMNGQIVRFKKGSSEFETVAQLGDEKNVSSCNDYGPNIHSKTTCGRPLGMRLVGGDLYVADSYLGLFRVNTASGEKKLLLGSNDKRFGDKPPKLVNDLDLDGELIYFIDSSYGREVNQAIEELIESHPRGRLFKFDLKTNSLELITDGLFFPNGLQLMPDKQSILINECSMSRILKVQLKGDKKGSKEVFANLPGFGDTIRLTDHNTLLVPLAGVRHSKYSSIQDLFGKFPQIRNFIGSVFNLRRMFMLLPKYGLLAEYDLKGNPIRSWHDPTGKTIECTTNAIIHDKKLYLGSYYNDFIGVVDY